MDIEEEQTKLLSLKTLRLFRAWIAAVHVPAAGGTRNDKNGVGVGRPWRPRKKGARPGGLNDGKDTSIHNWSESMTSRSHRNPHGPGRGQSPEGSRAVGLDDEDPLSLVEISRPTGPRDSELSHEGTPAHPQDPPTDTNR
jgi:hypothetical protein